MMQAFGSSESTRLAALAATGVATTAALVLLSRKLIAQPQLDISSLEELREYSDRSLLLSLLAGTPQAFTVRVCGVADALGPGLPGAIVSMGARLTELDLSGCGISQLDDSLGRLTELRRLCLAGCQLQSLPASICKLTCLEDLNLANNMLKELPAEIGALSSLKYLNLMHNQLISLPDSIGDLSNLYRLGLKSNHLTRLPDSIGKLTSVAELYLTDNQLESLPASIGSMTALVKLQASFNRLNSLPVELAELPNLELLRVACCQIDKCPVALRGMPKLAWFSISGNPCCPVKSPRSRVPTVGMKDLEVGRKLGDGASGEVFEARWQGKRVALKLFRADRSPDGHSRDEMAMAIALQGSKNLVRILAQLQQPLGLVMEFCEGRPLAEKPNLDSLLRCRWPKGTTYPVAFVLNVAHGLAGALEHLHYRGLAHGDVYAHNLLVNDDASSVILCDYGAAFPYAKKLPLIGGTSAYEAGEVRAYGLLLSDMVQRMDISFEGMEATIGCQRELLQLIQLCTATPPAKRPCFGAIGKKIRALHRRLDKGLSATTPRAEYADSVHSMMHSPTASEANGYFTPRSGFFTPRSGFFTARSIAEPCSP